MPGLVPDPNAKVAVMRKGGTIALSDYGAGSAAPPPLTFGLAWDITKVVGRREVWRARPRVATRMTAVRSRARAGRLAIAIVPQGQEH